MSNKHTDDLAAMMNEFSIVSESESPAKPKVSSPTQRWHCRAAGRIVGPFDFATIRTMAENGQISAHDRVKQENDTKWLLADSIPMLFDGLSQSSATQRAGQGGVVSHQRVFQRSQRPSQASGSDEKAPVQSSAISSSSTSPDSRATRPATEPVLTKTPPRPAHVASRPSVATPSTTTNWTPPRRPPARQSSSFSMPELEIGPKVWGTAAVVLLALGFWYVKPFRESHDDAYYLELTTGIYQAIESESDPDERTWVISERKAQVEAIGEILEDDVSSRRPALKELEVIYKDLYPKLVADGSEETRQALLTEFSQVLQRAGELSRS